MGIISDAKVLAEIADLASRVYGLVVDKGRQKHESDAKIRDLEKQIADLKAQAAKP